MPEPTHSSRLPGGDNALLFAAMGLLAGGASFLLQPVLGLFHLNRFWYLLAASALWAPPVWLGTVTFTLAFANLGESPARPATLGGVLSAAFNGFRFFPLIVFFGAGLPFRFAAALATGMNCVDVFASITTPGARWKPDKEQWLAIAVAFGLEAAFVLRYLEEPFVAAFALALGSAAMLSLSMRAGLTSADLGTTYRKCAASVALAVALTIYFTTIGRSHIARTPPAPPPRPQAEPPRETGQPPEPAANLGDGGLYGVILWPEVAPETRLVAPLPVWHGLSHGALAVPVTIPFSGEYWMFRLPYQRPPRNSYFRRGSPAKLSFRTVAGDPLMMEAQQKLDLPVALSCCDRIQVSILDADPHPGSILLELILIDGSGTVPHSQSLGSSMVGLTGGLEQLQFAIPEAPSIHEFNLIKVVFHRDRMNRSRSARIAIDRFVLLPKGTGTPPNLLKIRG